MEDEGPRAERVAEIRLGMQQRGDHLYTSALVAGELLVRPVEAGAFDLERAYLRLFRDPAISILPFDLNAASAYARIRADRSIHAPDAIHLACAAAAEIDLFITNDDRLSRKVVPGIKFISSLAKAPF